MNYVYMHDQTQILASLGWSEDLYENTQIKELIGKLNSYDIVIMNALYNYENSQDLTAYSKELNDYIKTGGCFIVTDANYPPQTLWLPSIDPNLVWNPSMKLTNNETRMLPWADYKHPLLTGENNPSSAWTYPDITSPAMTILYKNANGSPAVGVLELGEGVAIISSLYNQTGWPTEGFFKNLAKWIKDPARLAEVKKRNTVLDALATQTPILNVATLPNPPVIDGKLVAGEWDNAALIPDFSAAFNNQNHQPTKCKIARMDDNIYISFECTDNSPKDITNTAALRDEQTWHGDSVEVFLDPSGDRKSYYQFAVSSNGIQYDSMGFDAKWDTYWEAKTAITDNGWVAELRIPIAFTENPNSTWTANFCRSAKSGSSREYSAWSPVFGTFHQPLRFGSLTGMSTKPGSHTFVPQIRVDIPKRWFLGSNYLDITISKISKQSPKTILQLIDLATGNTVWSKNIEPGKKSEIKAKCNVDLQDNKLKQMQLVLVDNANRHRVLASSVVFKPESESALKLSKAFPIVGGAIQSKDPVKKLIVDVVTGYDKSDKLEMESIGKDPNGRIVSRTKRRIEARKDFQYSVDVNKLTPGKYDFTFKLLKNGKETASQTVPLTVAPPAATEVSFDDKHICYVNGKPFFPIGLYHVSQAAILSINEKSRAKGLPELDLFSVIKQVKDVGFNTIHYTWGMPDEKCLDYTQSLGMWIIPEVAAPTKENVATANKYSNVLMWYGSDEPSGETLNIIKHNRIQTALLDPNRPVAAAVNNPDLYEAALGGFDFVMMDPYVIRSAPMSTISSCIKRGLEASKGMKPVWLVPQAFTIDTPWYKEPTPDEIKCQAYIGLVNGATGFLWYAFWTSEKCSDNPTGRGVWVLSDSKLWDGFRSLNAEINKLAPIILTGKNCGPVKCSSPDVQTCIWKYKGKSYLLAVNTLYKPVNCTIKGMGENAEVMFENKKVVTEDGILKASFKPLEVHVYKF
jgi:hypothetical protein